MKILITGGSGFLGRNLTQYLKDKHAVFAPTHSELDLLDELALVSYLKKNEIEVVIHCAIVGSTRRTDNLPHIVADNMRMFLNLAGQSKFYRKMIHFGSGTEFDKRHALVNVSEDYKSLTLPESDYGFSKLLCSHFQEHYDNIFNLRIFGVYGKYDDYVNRFISNATARVVLGLPIVVYQDQLMDFVYADDLVKITDYFINNNPPHKTYNISSGQPRHLLDIAKMVIEVSGKKLDIVVKQPGMANEYTCDISRLKSEIPNAEFTDFKESLKQMYEWYNNRETLDSSKLPI